jgi:hypothetical protein
MAKIASNNTLGFRITLSPEKKFPFWLLGMATGIPDFEPLAPDFRFWAS